MLEKTQGATGASRRGAKPQKQKKAQGLVEGNPKRGCRLQGWGRLLMGMTVKLRSEGGAGPSQAEVDGKMWGSGSILQGE